MFRSRRGVKKCKPLEPCDQNHFPFERFYHACSGLASAFAVRFAFSCNPWIALGKSHHMWRLWGYLAFSHCNVSCALFIVTKWLVVQMSTFVCIHVWTWSPLAVQSVPNSVPRETSTKDSNRCWTPRIVVFGTLPFGRMCSPNVPGTQRLERITFSLDSSHVHWSHGQRSENIRSELSVSQMQCTSMPVCLFQNCTACNVLCCISIWWFVDLSLLNYSELQIR